MQESPGTVDRLSHAGHVVLLAAAYFAAAKLSLLLAIPPGYATPVWPPSGIAFAAVLLLGSRVWPGVWLGAVAANLTVEASLPAALAIATGNTLEAVAGATLVRRYIGVPRRFHRGEDVVTFVALAALSAAIAATIGLVPLALSHTLPWPAVYSNWWTWWQGDLSGIIIVTPLLLTWSARHDLAWSKGRILELACFAVLLLGYAGVAFADAATAGSASLRFLVLPFIIWAAFRFSQREVTTAIAAVSAVAVWELFSDLGSHAPLNEALLVLLAFNSTVVVTGLVLSAVVGERSVAMDTLRRRHAELEARVAARTRDLETTNRALHLDIAERERMEKLLLESELRFRTLIESVQDYAIFLLDPEGRVASWNRGAQKIKGYAAEEIVGRPHACFYTREEIERGKPRLVLELAVRDGHHEDEGWRARQDGTTFWANVIITALRDEAGTLRGFGNVTRDLTRRIQTEEALRRSERALRDRNVEFEQLFESAPDAVALVDPSGRIRRVNAQMETMFGYGRNELAGASIETLLPKRFHERHEHHRATYFADPRARPMGANFELLGQRRDGTEFPVDIMLSPVALEEGRFVLGVVRDVTERKRVETELMSAKALAEQANHAKSEFLAKMSHELRTPLNSLLILARLLADNAYRNLTPKQVKYAETIHDAGMDLLALINDVLDLARIESGAITALEISPVSFAALQNFVESAFRQLALQKGLRFDVTIDEGLPATMRTDARRLQQILKNLLSNAFKFTKQGSVSLSIAPAASGWARGHARLDRAATVVAFTVMDTGIGIAEDKQELIFEAFQQADGTTSRSYGGTGLGLSISREFVRLLDGDLRLDSRPGRGSAFTLYLALEHEAQESARPAPAAAAETRDGSP